MKASLIENPNLHFTYKRARNFSIRSQWAIVLLKHYNSTTKQCSIVWACQHLFVISHFVVEINVWLKVLAHWEQGDGNKRHKYVNNFPAKSFLYTPSAA